MRQRVPETDHGIVGEDLVEMYDRLQRNLRDKVWIETDAIIEAGISRGHALELGNGPGYLGLEWLKKTEGTSLTGVDISTDMIRIAERNVKEYASEGRTSYVHSSGSKIPFKEGAFDAVFTNGSLHEWADPRATFNEIWRVLRVGGKYFISDLRRDMPFIAHWFLRLNTRPKARRTGLESSIRASYTLAELRELVKGTRIEGCQIGTMAFGAIMTGVK